MRPSCSAKTPTTHVRTSAAEIAKDDKNVKIINNHRVIPMEVAIREGILFLIPEL